MMKLTTITLLLGCGFHQVSGDGCQLICDKVAGCVGHANGSYCKDWQKPSVCFGLYYDGNGICYHPANPVCSQTSPVYCPVVSTTTTDPTTTFASAASEQSAATSSSSNVTAILVPNEIIPGLINAIIPLQGWNTTTTTTASSSTNKQTNELVNVALPTTESPNTVTTGSDTGNPQIEITTTVSPVASSSASPLV